MPSTRDIRRRIKSGKNTAQIIKAMQLAAASKMKKAQDQAVAGRPYADLLNKVLVNLKEQSEKGAHPLFEERASGPELMVVVTSDKGLCGGLNTNILRLVHANSSANTEFVAVGVKGKRALAKLNRKLVADFPVKDPVQFAETKVISQFLMDKFIREKYAVVKVAFTNFINTVTLEPLIETLLPVRAIDLGDHKQFVGVGRKSENVTAPSHEPGPGGYVCEPSVEAVLGTIIPLYVNNELYQMVVESRASEHSARMVAMKNATDNAKDLIKELTLDYNKQRQAAITSELLEITTAMRALD